MSANYTSTHHLRAIIFGKINVYQTLKYPLVYLKYLLGRWVKKSEGGSQKLRSCYEAQFVPCFVLRLLSYHPWLIRPYLSRYFGISLAPFAVSRLDTSPRGLSCHYYNLDVLVLLIYWRAGSLHWFLGPQLVTVRVSLVCCIKLCARILNLTNIDSNQGLKFNFAVRIQLDTNVHSFCIQNKNPVSNFCIVNTIIFSSNLLLSTNVIWQQIILIFSRQLDLLPWMTCSASILLQNHSHRHMKIIYKFS